MTEQEKLVRNEEMRAAAKHQEVLKDIREVLATKSGKSFVKYLFEELCVGEMPAIGITGKNLYQFLGHHRAGNSIFKIVAQANPEVAGLILAQLEKEKYAQIQYDEIRQGE